MSLFKKNEIREVGADEVLYNIINNTESVSKQLALNIPAFSNALDYISENVAGLEVKLYREKDGKAELVPDYRCDLLNDDTKDALSGYDFKKAMVRDYFLHGGGYTLIDRNRNRVKRLIYIPNDRVSYKLSPRVLDRDCKYIVEGKEFESYEMIKLLRHTEDGYTGKGMLRENGNILAGAYAVNQLAKCLMQSGGNKRGVLTSEAKLTEEAFAKLKEAFSNLYTNKGTSFMVLNKGLDFKETANTAVELQLDENKSSFAGDIFNLFGLNGKTVDENIKLAVMPVITAFENALDHDLLLEREKAEGYYFAFDTKALLKGNIKERYSAYESAVKAGWITKNEIRYEEDMDALEGLDVVSMSLADVIYDPEKKQYFTPNMNSLLTADGTPKEAEDGNSEN